MMYSAFGGKEVATYEESLPNTSTLYLLEFSGSIVSAIEPLTV